MKISLLLIILIKCGNITSENDDNTKKETKSIRLYNTDRFLKDLDKEEWLVAHIKDTEMDGRRDCRGETFKDRARRYIDMLKRDAGAVEYVSSEPLPFEEADLVTDTCQLKIEENYNTTTEVSDMPAIPTTNTDSFDKEKTAYNSSVDINSTVPISDFKATTTPIMKAKTETNKEKDEISRRASEYMFSSVEYYEEAPVFDVSFCPEGTVEEIELEIDQLRSYDVVCEQMIEWRSLDIGS